MLEVLVDSCEAFLREAQEFWILAGLTDVSCETGGNRRYRQAVETFKGAGISESLVKKLQRGVNGNFAERIKSLRPELAPIRSNRRRGIIRPDIWFGIEGSEGETLLEIKSLHDWTGLPFYGHRYGHGVTDDADKLRRIRHEGFGGHLFQLVFFLQLPMYSYCSGVSYGQRHDSRESYRFRHGIGAQYRGLRKHLLQNPAWPSNAPKITPLKLEDQKMYERAEQWMKQSFKPDDSAWKFDAARQLSRAAVGCAIWKY